MKVKDLIEELKKLDQDREIFINYDGVALLEPIPSSTVKEEDLDVYDSNSYVDGVKCQIGDYLINAW